MKFYFTLIRFVSFLLAQACINVLKEIEKSQRKVKKSLSFLSLFQCQGHKKVNGGGGGGEVWLQTMKKPLFKDASFIFSLSKSYIKLRRECHSSHPMPERETVKSQNPGRAGVSEQLAKKFVNKVTEKQELFQSYGNLLWWCGKAKEMGSRRPVTMREEADNLVLSK